MAKFYLGQLVATSGVAEAMRENPDFDPCRVGECSMWRDGNEYIIYIPYSSEQEWLELTAREERADIEAALHR